MPDPQFRQRDPYFAEKKKEKSPKKRYAVEDFLYRDEQVYLTDAKERTVILYLHDLPPLATLSTISVFTGCPHISIIPF